MIHSDKDRLKKYEILASEVLKTVKRCRDEQMTEKEKEYHLSQIEALAGDTCCEQYESERDPSFK